jgi:hypothetical protein
MAGHRLGIVGKAPNPQQNPGGESEKVWEDQHQSLLSLAPLTADRSALHAMAEMWAWFDWNACTQMAQRLTDVVERDMLSYTYTVSLIYYRMP